MYVIYVHVMKTNTYKLIMNSNIINQNNSNKGICTFTTRQLQTGLPICEYHFKMYTKKKIYVSIYISKLSGICE